jgi:hypothetical protein
MPKERDAKDRSIGFLVSKFPKALLRLAGVEGVKTCVPQMNSLSVPKRIPDGLLAVSFEKEKAPVLFLLEATTYPDADEERQVLEDVAMVLLSSKVIPEVISIVLAPKGNAQMLGSMQRSSLLGTTTLSCTWKIVEMWKIEAEALLELGEAQLLPLLPLCKSKETPEAIVAQTNERIQTQAKEGEKESLLVMAAILSNFKFPTLDLRKLFRERTTMLIENPNLREWLQELYQEAFKNEIAEQLRLSALQGKRDGLLEGKREGLLRILMNRFSEAMTEEDRQQIGTLTQPQIDRLYSVAIGCSDLAAFRAALAEELAGRSGT